MISIQEAVRALSIIQLHVPGNTDSLRVLWSFLRETQPEYADEAANLELIKTLRWLADDYKTKYQLARSKLPLTQYLLRHDTHESAHYRRKYNDTMEKLKLVDLDYPHPHDGAL